MVERGAGMSVDSTLQVNNRIYAASFSIHRSLIIFTWKRKSKFPNHLFIPDKSAWPRLPTLGRLGQPQDIADVVAMLCSQDARWITGQNVRANGGTI